MTQELVLDIMRRSMVLATATATPILGIGMLVGLGRNRCVHRSFKV